MNRICLRLGVFCTVLFALLGSHRSALAQQANPPVVISQVYGGGGNSGAPYQNDFIELFNRSAAPVSLAGLSIQYSSAGASGPNFGSSTNLITVLGNVVLQPGQYYLIAEGGGANGVPLPAPNQTGTIAMGAGAGKVALVSSTSGLPCNGGNDACTSAELALIVDLVGYGTGTSGATLFEGASAAPTLSNTLSAQRGDGGCTDTNANGADLTSGAPLPRNGSSPLHVCGGTGGSVGACGDPSTNIGAIQGAAASSGMVGSVVNIEGVVVGDFQDGTLNGFYVQQPDATVDGDAATSDGIFVFEGSSAVSVNPGDVVRVRGQVAEFSGLTELTSVAAVVSCGPTAVASPRSLGFPVAAISDLERYEGMLVNVAQTLTVTGNFELGRFGSLDLSASGRLFNPTNVVAPGAQAVALQDLNDRSRIILDDASSTQNPNPIPYKDGNQSRRVGDTLPSLTGILDDRFSAYRIHPTVPPGFVNSNPRSSAPPAVGGRLKVVAMNVLNLFSTVDAGPDVCGPSGTLDCRGADSESELARQLDKLLNALEALSPDIAGLMEIENNQAASLQLLVDALNADLGAGTYAFVNTGTIGTDAIKLAFLYKPGTVDLVGPAALLTRAVNPIFIDDKNRPSLAQTFRERATSAKFTVIANHLKSKGSDCDDVGDPDLGDGQGNCNLTRSNAADALLSWIIGDPTGSNDSDYLLIGDLNAYAKEDPIEILKQGQLTSLIEAFVGQSAYSYQFAGQSGYLDHAFATGTMLSQVTGVAEWHSNADEPVVLDYNLEFKTDDPYNAGDPFRSSDHDPLVIGLNPAAPPSPVPAGHPAGFALLAIAFIASAAVVLNRRQSVA